ncbi:hypothetical protein FHQ08_12190 [Lactobacillus sp. CC-MHH1034]|uniref:aminoacyl--tRNA ligase-related protein n=1 Tax=Agrilactobacillus fermenti TaxID=2586909 RepID=UPI001E5A8E4B|nr:aminoacyl--tRNA ligase-related protein [Agrilactobacillus fermenti]MCD2257446.1 hypothetical protein [Agrilactobacillus fermenti]
MDEWTEIVNQFYRKGEKMHTSNILDSDFIEQTGYDNLFGKYLIKSKRDTFFSPTVCFDMFKKFCTDKREFYQPKIYSSINYCYRNETNIDKYRKRKFKMMELLIIGEETFVRGRLDDYIMELKGVIADKLKIESEILQASDGFFLSQREVEVLKQLQLSQKNKQELSVSVKSNTAQISIASANFHGEKYFRALGLTAKEGFVTGCFGIGIDRLEMLSNESKYQ